MSPYGATAARHGGQLASKHFAVQHHPAGGLIVYHISTALATAQPALADYLYAQFHDELDRGATYPQELPFSRTAFDQYFLSSDLFVAVIAPADDEHASLEVARGDREWSACVGGVYYVKPNYPGRSSHICNAGFFVVPRFRGIGIATALARSFVENAPLLGYKASVFNLVYVNNTASVRLWDRLGFKKVGRIPNAGRLKRADGNGEEYVDAWVVYKSFEDGGDNDISL